MKNLDTSTLGPIRIEPGKDDALVEIMAIAAAAAQGWRWYDFKQMIDVQDGAVCSRNRHSWRASCRAALNALREHGKENT